MDRFSLIRNSSDQQSRRPETPLNDESLFFTREEFNRLDVVGHCASSAVSIYISQNTDKNKTNRSDPGQLRMQDCPDFYPWLTGRSLRPNNFTDGGLPSVRGRCARAGGFILTLFYAVSHLSHPCLLWSTAVKKKHNKERTVWFVWKHRLLFFDATLG